MDKKFIQNRISELKDYNNYSEYQLSYELGKSKGYIQSITSGRSLPSMQVFLYYQAHYNKLIFHL